MGNDTHQAKAFPQMSDGRSTTRGAVVAIVCGVILFLVIHGILLVGAALSVLPGGTDIVLLFAPTLVLSVGCGSAAVFVLSVLWQAPMAGRTTSHSARGLRAMMIGSGTYIILFALLVRPTFATSLRIRLSGFRHVATVAEPLVRAIARYQVVHGSPPKRLTDLVPGLLPCVPMTQLGGHAREFRYVTFARGEDGACGNAWALEVSTPSGLFDFDTLVFHPNGEYPDSELGGRVVRTGDWAYVQDD